MAQPAKTKRLEFFAAGRDLAGALGAIERAHRLKYVEAGLFDTDARRESPTASDLPDLSIATHGDTNLEREFLVSWRDEPVVSRQVPQRRGPTRFALDQLMNPNTIAFRPGGAFGSTALIAGRVATVSDSAGSRALFKVFADELKRRFSRVKSYYVGDEAAKLLDSGCRLTASVRSPPTYDLRR